MLGRSALLAATGSNLPDIIRTGLVLNLDAGNAASYPGSGTVWADLSGNGNNGTLIDGVGYSGANGGYLILTGGYVNLGDPSSLRFGTGDWAFECFVRPNNIQQAGAAGAQLASKTFGEFEAFWYNSQFGHFIAGSSRIYSLSDWSNGIWYQIVFSKQSGVYTFYRNAIDSGQTINSNNISAAGNPWLIGARSPSGGGPLAGNIPIVRMYNRALSAAEVSQNFNALRGRYGI
jgi:hypothetical protein